MINKRILSVVVIFLSFISCTPKKKYPVPAFVTNKKVDTYFFEQAIHRKNSTEVLFYFKFNYKRNEISIFRPEHSNVGFEVTKELSPDSLTMRIGISYFGKTEKTFKISSQKKGTPGLDKSFVYSDEKDWQMKNYASGSRTILLVKEGDHYDEIGHLFFEEKEEIDDLRYFIFDDNPEEEYFFRFNNGERTIFYPKEKD